MNSVSSEMLEKLNALRRTLAEAEIATFRARAAQDVAAGEFEACLMAARRESGASLAEAVDLETGAWVRPQAQRQ